MVYFNHETYNTFVELLQELDLDPTTSDEIKQRICKAAKFDPNRVPVSKNDPEATAARRREAARRYKDRNREMVREKARIYNATRRNATRLQNDGEKLDVRLNSFKENGFII
jgi:ribosomal protein S24E